MACKQSRLGSPFRRRLLLVLAAAATLSSFNAGAENVPLVAAASDLKFVLDELARVFQANTGKSVKIVYGSSGNFRRQISEGAPFEIFFSADEGFVQALVKDRLTLDEGKLYAIGRIVVIVPENSPLKPNGDLSDLAGAITANRIKRFAIANPEHAPYGRAAKEALEKAGLWTLLEDKLVLGENISQAAQFATTGSTDGGIIAYSLALAPAVSRHSRYALIPASWHSPLRQKMVLLPKAGDTAKDFYRFVQAPPARTVFKKYGFALPGE
ncbi:MAG: molybdenum transporter, periplasmic molybdate-binding protein [Herminiimonas sp.]|nr:molybdenum transporter, periplasmic molybdate-binding protein [Herminiimonas sp.]